MINKHITKKNSFFHALIFIHFSIINLVLYNTLWSFHTILHSLFSRLLSLYLLLSNYFFFWDCLYSLSVNHGIFLFIHGILWSFLKLFNLINIYKRYLNYTNLWKLNYLLLLYLLILFSNWRYAGISGYFYDFLIIILSVEIVKICNRFVQS